MKVGVNTATKLKEKSIELSIPFSNLLWGFVLEDLLDRIAKSSYKEHILLADQGLIGVENYKQPAEGRLTFYYKESENAIGFLRTTPHILCPAKAPAPRYGQGKNKSKKIEKRG